MGEFHIIAYKWRVILIFFNITIVKIWDKSNFTFKYKGQSKKYPILYEKNTQNRWNAFFLIKVNRKHFWTCICWKIFNFRSTGNYFTTTNQDGPKFQSTCVKNHIMTKSVSYLLWRWRLHRILTLNNHKGLVRSSRSHQACCQRPTSCSPPRT